MTRAKLPADYKFVYQNQDKRIEKIREFLGHKLRDLLAYPEALIKKIIINKGDYLYYKASEENSESKQNDTNSDDSSD